jgi:hypothetical protein
LTVYTTLIGATTKHVFVLAQRPRADNGSIDFLAGVPLMGKVDKVFSNLSLQARTRLSALAVEKKEAFSFNNEKLQEFLKHALEHLKNATNTSDAEHIAHFLMGIKTDLPKGLEATDVGLNDEQKRHLHDALRTNRYGIFGKEKDKKTIEKLSALHEEVNFDIEWSKKKFAQEKEITSEEKKTIGSVNYKTLQPKTKRNTKQKEKENHTKDYSPQLSSNSGLGGGVKKIKVRNKNNSAKEKANRIDENIKNRSALNDKLEALYKTASRQYTSDEKKWAQLKEKISDYFNIMAGENSTKFTEILSGSRYTFDQLVESFTMYTALPNDIATKMATERELVNIQMQGKSRSENKQVLGQETSLAQRDFTVIQPGNQLSLATTTKIRCNNGQLKEITLLSGSAPALDIASQPEAAVYTFKSSFGGRKLNRQKFSIALDTLKSHILQCAEKKTDCKRVALAGIGAENFLKLLDEEHRKYAQDMIATLLAEVATELRAQGKEVVFTDIDDKFCNKINAKLGSGEPPIDVPGPIPGNWIKDGDLMLNAWDPHSLLGNGLAADNSLDGFYGRNSLIHFQHALLCMMTSLSIPVNIKHVPTDRPTSNPIASSS